MKKFKFFSIVLVLLSFQVKAQSIQQLGPNYFVAGVASDEFEFFAVDRQRSQNWCWAASSQMVLNYHGLYVSQEQIVARVFGSLVDRPANNQEIMSGLSGWAPNVAGGVSNIYCEFGVSSANEITQNLAYKWPLIVGLRNPQGGIGHAYVLTAIYYNIDQFNNTIPEKVVLRDPWPDNPSRQEMSWQEFMNRQMGIIKVWVSR